MNSKYSRFLIAGSAVTGLIVGAAIAMAQTEPGPKGERPPVFGPGNPAPSMDVTYQQSSQELWARSFDLDQLFVRTAGLDPQCGSECLIDNAPEELGHLFEATCASLDKIQYDRLYPNPDSEFAALRAEVARDCDDVAASVAANGNPDSSDPEWQAAVQGWHNSINAPLKQARALLDAGVQGSGK